MGSRVTVIRKDDHQLHELTAGAGYLSQSTTEMFLVSDSTNPIVSFKINWPDGSEQVVPFPETPPLRLVVKKK
ncbi:MAG: ASPIC/UnbV domain-containing protein [Rubripirellula sp.]